MLMVTYFAANSFSIIMTVDGICSVFQLKNLQHRACGMGNGYQQFLNDLPNFFWVILI